MFGEEPAVRCYGVAPTPGSCPAATIALSIADAAVVTVVRISVDVMKSCNCKVVMPHAPPTSKPPERMVPINLRCQRRLDIVTFPRQIPSQARFRRVDLNRQGQILEEEYGDIRSQRHGRPKSKVWINCAALKDASCQQAGPLDYPFGTSLHRVSAFETAGFNRKLRSTSNNTSYASYRTHATHAQQERRRVLSNDRHGLKQQIRGCQAVHTLSVVRIIGLHRLRKCVSGPLR